MTAPAAIVPAFPDRHDLASGKDDRGENFPVASWLVKPVHRPPIMAFYRFARAADDIADHPAAPPEDKLVRLAAMRAGLDGAPAGHGAATAVALARIMAERGLDPVHAHDLLDAFVQDVTVRSYATWDALIGYCRLSAMPVGRFVLDVHGEDRAIWPLCDALCAALQIVNHLQDCGKDYRALRRVYLPDDALAAMDVRPDALGDDVASPRLRAVITALATRTAALLRQSADFAARVADRRLALEIAVIHRLAADLAERLRLRDPLSERVHHRGGEAMALAARAIVARMWPGGGR